MTAVEPDHPASYSAAVLAVLELILQEETDRQGRRLQVLDPFGGVGRIHVLDHLADTFSAEIQPRWAAAVPGRSVAANSRALPYPGRVFDAIVTSPCLEQSHRILTDDLRWVPAGDLVVGDRILAFDESGTEGVGTASRRRWRRAEVVRSEPRKVGCVRVILANGDELVTTPEHPWLAQRYAYGGRRAEWRRSVDLAGWHVMRQVEPWTQRRSFDAGWLSGMFDGEGSLSLGQHGSPKLQLCQVDGPVLDRAEALMESFGYAPNRIWRTGVPGHRQKIGNLYVTGGFPGLLRALGELRPTRLLSKWETLDIGSRTIQAEKVPVVGIEDAGVRDIQEIETSTGTYIGEGYLHHNCYGNRLADTYDGSGDRCTACDGTGDAAEPELTMECPRCDGTGLAPSKRYTYRISHGAPLHPDNAANGMHWGTGKRGDRYRELHRAVWRECYRVLRPGDLGPDGDGPRERGGLFVVNISNFYRQVGPKHDRRQEQQLVTEWHLEAMLRLGLVLVEARRVPTPRIGHGANRDARCEAETVLVFRRPDLPPTTHQGVLLDA